MYKPQADYESILALVRGVRGLCPLPDFLQIVAEYSKGGSEWSKLGERGDDLGSDLESSIARAICSARGPQFYEHARLFVNSGGLLCISRVLAQGPCDAPESESSRRPDSAWEGLRRPGKDHSAAPEVRAVEGSSGAAPLGAGGQALGLGELMLGSVRGPKECIRDLARTEGVPTKVAIKACCNCGVDLAVLFEARGLALLRDAREGGCLPFLERALRSEGLLVWPVVAKELRLQKAELEATEWA